MVPKRVDGASGSESWPPASADTITITASANSNVGASVAQRRPLTGRNATTMRRMLLTTATTRGNSASGSFEKNSLPKEPASNAREGLKSSAFADWYHAYLDIRNRAGEDPLLNEVRQRAQ